MLFNSHVFIYLFLPLTLFSYYALNRCGFHHIAKWMLVGASLYFYAYFEISYLAIIVSSVLINYFAGTVIQKHTDTLVRQLFYIAAILFNVLLLGVFKYLYFVTDNLNFLLSADFPLISFLLPLGISFFTFQQISYITDLYYQKSRHHAFVDYSLFVTFFPQLIAGPIVLPSEMLPQFADPANQKMNACNTSHGLFLFGLGLLKKVFVADTLALIANAGYSHSGITFTEAWLTSLSYTLQLYFDFSGYCDMAMGVALMFNIHLPLNFNSPYQATNFQDFWRRWHMTLGRFMMNYLYIPLGGNRHGKARTLLNLMIVFMVSGIWHGAGWTFFIWGLLHGCGILFYRIFAPLLSKITIPRICAIAITFFFVNIFWIFFRAENLKQAWRILSTMFDFTHIQGTRFYFEHAVMDENFNFTRALIVFFVALGIVFIFPNTNDLRMKIKNEYLFSAITVVSLLVGLLFLTRITPFLYFNF